MIFSFLIILLISLGNFFPHYIPVPLLGNIDVFFVITGLLLIVHFLFAIGFKIAGLIFNANSSSNPQE